jgi:Fe-S-cluster containining protein
VSFDPPVTESTIDAVSELHREIDGEASRLEQVHGSRLRCERGCASCCVDELTVLEVEAARIQAEHGCWLAAATPRAAGACAMLGNDDECRIYSARPYVCRTQGLPLRWFEETDGGDIAEESDICPLNLEGPAIEALEPDRCWLIGPYEQRLVTLQQQHRGALRRIRLRDLFGAV